MRTTTNKQQPVNYLLFIGILIIATNLRSPITAISPLLDLIREDLNVSLALSGLLTTLPLVAFALFSIIAPITERKFGIERVLFASLLVLAIGIWIRSAGNQFMLFFGTILIGIAIAHCNVLVPSLVKRDFSEQSGLATGLYSVTMNVFGALASSTSLNLANKYGLGWRQALQVWLITCLIALVLWLPQLKKNTVVKIKPIHQPRKSMVRSLLAWQISLLMGIQSLIFYTIVTWLPAIISYKELHVEAAGSMLGIMQLVIVPVTLIVSILAAKMTNQVVLSLFGTSTLLAGILLLWVSPSISIAVVALGLIGAGCGSCFSLAMIFFSLRTQNASEASQLSGLAQSIGYLLASFGPFVFGLLYDVTASWTSGFIVLIILCGVIIYAGVSASREGYV